MQYQPYLNQGLNNFEDVLLAFTKYSDGGYWVKRIDYKESFYREIADGPFDRKTAEKKSKLWNEFFKYKDYKTAKMYSFKELVCECNSGNNELEKEFFEEYIWKPPRGASLMCLFTGTVKILMDYEGDKSDSFGKFEAYVLQVGVSKAEASSRNGIKYNIYYLERDADSYYKAMVMKKIVEEYGDQSDSLIWLYDELQNYGHKRGVKPFLMPQYLEVGKNMCLPITLDTFKKYNNLKDCRQKRKIIFEDLKKCVPEYNIELGVSSNGGANIILNLKFLLNGGDYKIKDFFIAKDEKNNFSFGIEYPDNGTSMKIEETSKCNGKIISSVGIERFDRSMNLMLYLAKTLGFTSLSLTDDLKMKCGGTTLISHNILLYIDDQPSYYHKFGFNETNKEQRMEKIKPFQEKMVGSFLEEDDEIFEGKDLKELVYDYLHGMDKYAYICEILSRVTEKIKVELDECCMKHIIHLDNLNWDDMLENII
jgi:hypothetical protein